MFNFSPASERNRQPIAERLADLFTQGSVVYVLETGSGSGQHALFFTERWPKLQWQCSELAENLPALRANLDGRDLPEPVELDVAGQWRQLQVDMLYSANTLHIMAWDAVVSFLSAAGQVVRPGGWLCVYGPFRYNGAFTTDSNAEFDRKLRARNEQSGIRDFEAVTALAEQAGFRLQHDYAMPANNQLLVWQRTEAEE